MYTPVYGLCIYKCQINYSSDTSMMYSTIFEKTERNELAWVCKRKQSHDGLSLFELRLDYRLLFIN